ncbi:hypothetical protein SAMN04487965_2390 [Microbulbifer donghaiensis]|uniref:Uncharacterized protein n=1 Tax=Microbulbifer donghaiensis TaxID=494016 RepID=A0A1M5D2X4_9GAMM|nr:hypothetical protein [Microbulbifer donghaiensis]SHF61403.1 hypothetical protein SAMN04487965_2390 [Microbulbifer donghaiensis]
MKWTLILLSLLYLSFPLSAQEQPQEQEEEPVKVAQAKPDKETEKSDADDYKASEEISEDLSVSYPVDI